MIAKSTMPRTWTSRFIVGSEPRCQGARSFFHPPPKQLGCLDWGSRSARPNRPHDNQDTTAGPKSDNLCLALSCRGRPGGGGRCGICRAAESSMWSVAHSRASRGDAGVQRKGERFSSCVRLSRWPWFRATQAPRWCRVDTAPMSLLSTRILGARGFAQHIVRHSAVHRASHVAHHPHVSARPKFKYPSIQQGPVPHRPTRNLKPDVHLPKVSQPLAQRSSRRSAPTIGPTSRIPSREATGTTTRDSRPVDNTGRRIGSTRPSPRSTRRSTQARSCAMRHP